MHSNSFFSSSPVSSVNLTEQEEKALNAIEREIDANDDKNIGDVIDALIKYPIDSLQKLYQKSNQKNTKFKDFCLKNVKFHEAIANDLQSHGYVNVEIISMDGKEHLNLFDIFIAAGNLSQYYTNLLKARTDEKAKNLCTQALETACQLGLYQALTARCDQNTTMLLSQTASEESKEKAIASILKDTKRLSNLYWKMGYIQAGCILQKMVEMIAPVWEKKGREEIDRLAIYYEKSITDRLCASFLENHPSSKKIELGLTGGKGYVAYIMDKKSIKMPSTWEEAKIKIHSWVNDDDATYKRLLGDAETEIDTLLEPSVTETKLTHSPK